MCSVVRTLLLITVAIFRVQGRDNQTTARAAPGQTYKIATTNSCECGILADGVGTRIVGGSVTQPHRYPWMVAILNSGKLHCGGSLINDRYVLTAGHCLNWARKEDLSVILGMHDRVTMEEGTEKLVDIDKLIVHEAFSSDYLHDTEDIGLIRLKSPVHYSRFISPVCLPKPGTDYTHRIGLVTGWGRTAQNGNPSRYLRKAGVKILLQSDCRNTTIGEHIMDTMMCAYEFETDACQGDSGGPLIFEMEKGKVEQIGIVSWGIGCAKQGMPGVYTKLTEYLMWIKSHTMDAVYCSTP